MNKITSTLLTIALAGSALWAADPPEKKEVPLPVPVVKADEAMETAVSKALAIYLKTVDAEVKKMQALLEKEKTAATRAGNLDLAMAIKAKQEALTVDAVVTNAAGRGSDLLGEGKPDLAKAIVGKWGNGNTVRWEFFADGSGKHYGTTEYSITWKSLDDNTFEIGGGVGARNLVVTSTKTCEEITKNSKIQLQKMK